MTEPFNFLKELDKDQRLYCLSDETRNRVRDLWAKHHFEMRFHSILKPYLLFEKEENKRSFMEVWDKERGIIAKKQVELVWSRERIEKELKKKMEEKK